jgi:G patch domain-containing protein 1
MYGPLTHEVQPWYPHRLLCKRFGLRDPHPDGAPVAASKTWEEEVGVASTAPPPPPDVDLADVEMRPLDAEGDGDDDDGEGEDLGPRDLSNVGLGEDPHQGVDTLTYVRPGMDVFKAIFASDEEDSDEEEETKKEAKEVPVSALDVALASSRPAVTGSEGPVDVGTFRPVFNIRTKGKDKDKDKKKDKKKEKNKRAVLSFDIDEGADEDTDSRADTKKSKRRERGGGADRASKKPKTLDEEGEGEWIEKPPHESVATAVPIGMSLPIGAATKPESSGARPSAPEPGASTRTRKRAIDFM